VDVVFYTVILLMQELVEREQNIKGAFNYRAYNVVQLKEYLMKLAFVDTETTGLDVNQHEIWEVALMLYEDGILKTERIWELPVDLGKADPMALKINKFYERSEQSKSDELYYDFSKKMNFAKEFVQLTDGAHLVGAIVSFDEERLRKLVHEANQCHMWHYHIIDVESLAAGHLNLLPPWKSTDVWNKLGIEIDESTHHTAMGDVEVCVKVFEKIFPDYLK
jgi:DNA polymerase III epsilon subunit-like protein